MIDVEVFLAVLVEEESAKVGGVGDVGDLCKFLREGELYKIFKPGEVNAGESLLDGHDA